MAFHGRFPIFWFIYLLFPVFILGAITGQVWLPIFFGFNTVDVTVERPYLNEFASCQVDLDYANMVIENNEEVCMKQKCPKQNTTLPLLYLFSGVGLWLAFWMKDWDWSWLKDRLKKKEKKVKK